MYFTNLFSEKSLLESFQWHTQSIKKRKMKKVKEKEKRNSKLNLNIHRINTNPLR